MQIEVYQHIFSNVPKEQSPWGRRGYQTLFYTLDDLTEDEIMLLEERAQYYGDESEPQKWQFFILPNGKAVISQVVSLTELDEFGRKGRYLAHSFVLPMADFQKLENCPLGFFTSSLFISDLETAFKEGDQLTGNIPRKSIELSEDWQDTALQAVQEWPTDQLARLVRLGWQAQELKTQRQSVALIGNHNEIFSLLKIIFLLTHPNKRPFLTFDTYAQGCDWGREWPFWVWGGLNEDDVKKTSFQIDVPAHQVQASLATKEDTPFERWVTRKIIPTHLDLYLAYREDALILTDVLEGKKVNLDGVDKNFAEDFANMNVNKIEQQVLARLPEGLCEATLDQVLKDIRKNSWDYLKQLSIGLTNRNIAEILYSLLTKDLKMPLDKADYRVITQFAKETDYPILLNVLELRSNLSNWQKSLEHLTGDDYRHIVRVVFLQHFTTAANAFCPTHLTIWCEESGKFLRLGELKVVLDQLKKYKAEFEADSFIFILPYLASTDKEVMIKWLRSYHGSAPQLRSALNIAQEPSNSILGRLKSLFGHSEK